MGKSFKSILLLAGLISFFVMANMKFDKDFILTLLLPLFFAICVKLFYKDKIIPYGPCSKCLMIFYTFRMCILPIICAWGNFYIEISKNDYIGYYNIAILSICLEFLIVILSVNYFSKKYQKRTSEIMLVNNHRTISWIVACMVVLFLMCYFFLSGRYYYFIADEMKNAFEVEEVVQNRVYYIMDMLSNMGRPLLSFILIYYGLNKKGWIGVGLIIIVCAFNLLVLSDRRIYSLLISGVSLYYILTQVRSKFVTRLSTITLLISISLTIYMCFYFQIGDGDEMISRTFQHYFSGPSLTAIAFAADNRYHYDLFDFWKLLFNDFQTLTAIFKSYEIKDAYVSVFGFGKGIWTPMFAGAIRFFGIFAPIFPIFFVKLVSYFDFKIRGEKDVIYKMTYMFLGVTLSCYMVMYTLELIIYFVLSTVPIYSILLKLNAKNGRKVIINTHILQK